MSDLRSEVIDILAKMQFFQGQRAGRELWNDKPAEVQEQDLESFNKGIKTIRKYILQLEKSVEPARGEWAHIGGDEWCCSNCGHVISTEGSWEKPEKKFCEECGADMRKKVE